MNELNLTREEIDGTREADIDFWALRVLSDVQTASTSGAPEANPQILIDQNNIYLAFKDPKEMAEFKAYLVENGIEISEEQELICG